jgi:hypothetical protein
MGPCEPGDLPIVAGHRRFERELNPSVGPLNRDPREVCLRMQWAGFAGRFKIQPISVCGPGRLRRRAALCFARPYI